MSRPVSSSPARGSSPVWHTACWYSTIAEPCARSSCRRRSSLRRASRCVLSLMSVPAATFLSYCVTRLAPRESGRAAVRSIAIAKLTELWWCRHPNFGHLRGGWCRLPAARGRRTLSRPSAARFCEFCGFWAILEAWRPGLDNTKYGRIFDIILIRIIRNTWSSQV